MNILKKISRTAWHSAGNWVSLLQRGNRQPTVQPLETAKNRAARPRFSTKPERDPVKVVEPIVYRRCRVGDEVPIMQAFNETFGLSRSPDYWLWKFCQRGAPLAVIAIDSAGIVHAQFAAVPTVWVDNRTRQAVVQGCDFFSRRHPKVIRGNFALRTLNVFHQTVSQEADIKLIFGFPNQTSAGLYNTRFPVFQSAKPISTYRRSVSAAEASDPLEHGAITSIPLRDQIDDLWNRAAHRYERASPRDANWYHWRFVDRPDVTGYRPLSYLRGDGTLAAWLMLHQEGKTMWICDLVWDGQSNADLAALDQAVVVETALAGAQYNGMWLQGDEDALAVLLDRGWKNRTHKQTIHFFMHLYDSSLSPMDIYSRLYLTMADSDHI
jgi:hypothetical protein